MSVSHTEDAVVAREKTVTRRLGWRFLKPGDRLCLVRKAMGRRAGEPLVRLAEGEVVSVRREPLEAMTHEDVREGGDYLPLVQDMGETYADAFVRWFSKAFGCAPDADVTRIEWRYLS